MVREATEVEAVRCCCSIFCCTACSMSCSKSYIEVRVVLLGAQLWARLELESQLRARLETELKLELELGLGLRQAGSNRQEPAMLVTAQPKLAVVVVVVKVAANLRSFCSHRQRIAFHSSSPDQLTSIHSSLTGQRHRTTPRRLLAPSILTPAGKAPDSRPS